MSTAAFIAAVVAMASLALGGFTVVAQVLGARITDLGTQLGGRIGALENRMNALEGGVRDIGARLTVLETDLGKR